MKLTLLILLATTAEEPPKPKRLSLEACLALAQRNTGWRKQKIAYLKKAFDLRSQLASFLPTLGVGYTCPGEVGSGSGSVSVSQSTLFGTSVTLTGAHSFDPSEAVPADRADTSLSLSISHPLLRGAGRSDNLCDLRQARHRLKIAEDDLEAGAQDTVYQVRRQYYTVARLTETVRVRESAIERARLLYDEAAAKLEKGMVTILDLANAEIQLADRETSVVSAKMNLEGALDQLKILLDLPLEKEIGIEPVTLDLEVVETKEEKKEIVVDADAGKVWSERTIPKDEERAAERKLIFSPAKRSYERVLKEALERRPDLRATEKDLRIDELERDRKKNLARHRLDLTGSYTLSGTGATSEESFYLGDEAWSVGLSYTYPLGKVSDKTAYEKALLDVANRKIVIWEKKRSATKSIRDIFRTLGETEKNILTYARKIAAASKALESAKIRKERGKASYWEVTARESDLLTAQTSFINAYLTYQETLALLDKESGKPSGWISKKPSKRRPGKKAKEEKKRKEKGK